MRTVKLKMSSGKRKGSGVLSLQGSLTLDCVDEILHFFRNAVKQYKDLELKIRSVEGIDLGFIQLLHSLDVAQQERGHSLEVSMLLPTEMSQLLHATGFSRWLGERESTAK